MIPTCAAMCSKQVIANPFFTIPSCDKMIPDTLLLTHHSFLCLWLTKGRSPPNPLLLTNPLSPNLATGVSQMLLLTLLLVPTVWLKRSKSAISDWFFVPNLCRVFYNRLLLTDWLLFDLMIRPFQPVIANQLAYSNPWLKFCVPCIATCIFVFQSMPKHYPTGVFLLQC